MIGKLATPPNQSRFDAPARTIGSGQFVRSVQPKFPTIGDSRSAYGGTEPSTHAVQFRRRPPAGRAISQNVAPVRVALKVQEYWGLSDDDMLKICGLSLEAGESLDSALSLRFRLQDIQDRLKALLGIKQRLGAMYSTRDAELHWLRSPARMLNGQIPLTLMTEGHMKGLLRVEDGLRTLTSS